MRAGQILVKNCRDCGVTFSGGQGCGPRCGSCYQKWRRAGRPGDAPRPRLKLSDSGYSAAAGIADWRAAS
jgi:hypothetical protein